VKEKYILSVDQSTSGTKALIFNGEGKLINRCTVEHEQYYPRPGWVEHDPVEIYENTLRAIGSVLENAGINKDCIDVVAITNQRETAMVWDKNTGQPVYNAIVWQCQRAACICSELKDEGLEEVIKKKTGLILSPYFSAAKIKWILDKVQGAREKAEKGELLLGTMDSWLIWKLTGGKIHATDFSNASRTQIFNIKELAWDKELLKIFTIPESMLPEVKYSDQIFGHTTLGGILGREIPISGVAGDSHAALFGQNCFEVGMAKATYGTGSSIMMNIGKGFKESNKGLVTSLAWGCGGEVEYVFEGNINCTGDTIKWMVDNLELIPNSMECEQIAAKVKENEGVYLVPAFVGLGAPYWDSEARAGIIGMSRGTVKAHIVRAALEAIAYQVKDVVDIMIEESGVELKELRVDGGATRNNLLMQFQADMLNTAVNISVIEELSALGAAYMAGLAVGIWEHIEEIKGLRLQGTTFKSSLSSELREKNYSGWKTAVGRLLSRQGVY
jgi:glycerol kinase